LLGVTGGVAAYKSPDLVRRLIERGAQVQVVMTRGAQAFVSPLTFQAVSSRRVRDDIWDTEAEAAMGHIELARWADLVLIAPATAHCLGSLANGLAADLLSTICLATKAPIMVAPAMNHVMWRHPAVQANKQLLEQRGARFLGPATGAQACGEEGPRSLRGSHPSPSRDVRLLSRRARLVSRSIRSVTSRTVARGRWVMRSRTLPNRLAGASCS
jgi:phosphopantothenoylcysteine decarboxylase/phosphopantothenate--cysteine ligase